LTSPDSRQSYSLFPDRDAPKSRQCPFPYTRNFSVDTIVALAQKLWREITVGKQPLAKIHNIALSFHGLASAGAGQKLIEGFFTPNTGEDTRLDGSSPKKRSRVVADGEDKDEDERVDAAHEMSQSFVCDKCSKRICLPAHSQNQLESEADVKRALELLKMEHADYHFARDLARQTSEDDVEPVASSRPLQKKKKSTTSKRSRSSSSRQKERQGIARYFDASSSSSSTTGKGLSSKRA